MKKLDTYVTPLEKSLFVTSPNPVLKVTENEQLQQTLRASLSDETYRHNEQGMRQFLIRPLHIEHCSVTSLNGGLYFQWELKKTARKPSSRWTMTNPSKSVALIFLRDISLVHTSIVPKTLSCPCTYLTGFLMGYTVQKNARARTTLVHTTKLQPLYNRVV